ncbi:hypothetical protein GGI35DRAFT_463027 [Trichoderma velutinum]
MNLLQFINLWLVMAGLYFVLNYSNSMIVLIWILPVMGFIAQTTPLPCKRLKSAPRQHPPKRIRVITVRLYHTPHTCIHRRTTSGFCRLGPFR